MPNITCLLGRVKTSTIAIPIQLPVNTPFIPVPAAQAKVPQSAQVRAQPGRIPIPIITIPTVRGHSSYVRYNLMTT